MPKFTVKGIDIDRNKVQEFEATNQTAKAIFETMSAYASGDPLTLGREGYKAIEHTADTEEFRDHIDYLCQG